MKDIKKNHFKNNIIFNDELIYKNIFCYKNKIEKLQKNDPDFINLIQ